MNLNHRALIACVSVLCVASQAFAQSNPRYVRFTGVPASVKGALYMPDAPLPAPHVGIVVMHRTSNFMTALACTELSRRGFAVLCMNPRSDNNEAAVRFETIPLDVRAGVQFLEESARHYPDCAVGLERRRGDDDFVSERRRERRLGVPGPRQAGAVRK